MNKEHTKCIKPILFGVLVGDALGLSHEFETREALLIKPVTDIVGYGTHNQPPGTFSDDGSLTLCLAEALTNPFDIDNVAMNFSMWLKSNYWTAHGNVFDVGITTYKAINRYVQGMDADLCGGDLETDNGNGSLMRIAPLVFNLIDKPIDERFNLVKSVSSLTHRHIRSIIACFYYLEFLRKIILGIDKFEAYKALKIETPSFLKSIGITSDELHHFERLLHDDISEQCIDDIKSGGYVVDTLEASIWCILTTDNFSDAVLKAVNLGDDTDTTGAVTGGLAGALYEFDEIPRYWLRRIAKNKEIKILAEKLRRFYSADAT